MFYYPFYPCFSGIERIIDNLSNLEEVHLEGNPIQSLPDGVVVGSNVTVMFE